MFIGKNSKEQKPIVAILQGEDDVFHRTIIALERLELCLSKGRKTNTGLQQTAIGTSRDYHSNDSLELEECFLELLLQCKTLYMNANYKEKDFFDIAVEAFMKNLLEWYAGRQFLDYYDEVDAAIIPIMVAVSHRDSDIDAIYEKYVHITPKIEQLSVEEKYNATQDGVLSWIKGQWLLNEERHQKTVHVEGEDAITSHERGSAVDGFKRAITALTAMFEESAPAKIVLKMVKEYLPGIPKLLPNINEEAIDKIFAQKVNGSQPMAVEKNIDRSRQIETKDIPSNKMELISNRIKNAITPILEECDIPYSDIKVSINVNINIK